MSLDTRTIYEVKQDLVQLMRTLRKQHKLSQAELAAQIGVSRITIQNIESAKNITLDTLLKVFKHFDLLQKFHSFIQDEKDDRQIPSLY